MIVYDNVAQHDDDDDDDDDDDHDDDPIKEGKKGSTIQPASDTSAEDGKKGSTIQPASDTSAAQCIVRPFFRSHLGRGKKTKKENDVRSLEAC